MIDPNAKPRRMDPTSIASSDSPDTQRPAEPAAGAVLPTARGNLVLALVIMGVGGGLAAAIPFATGPVLIALTVASGIVSSVGAALGIMSAGYRRP